MEEYYHYYRLVHYLHSDKVLEGLHLVFVELPKFKARNLTEKRMMVLWLRFLTEIGEATAKAPQDLVDNLHLNEALEIVEESALSDEERAAYEGFWDRVSREASKAAEMKAAIAARDTAVAERDAAVAERDAATARADEVAERLRQTICNLKDVGMSVEQVSQVTGLKPTEVETFLCMDAAR